MRLFVIYVVLKLPFSIIESLILDKSKIFVIFIVQIYFIRQMNIINANDLEIRNKKSKGNHPFALEKHNRSYFNDNATTAQKYSEMKDCLRVYKSIEHSLYDQQNLYDRNDEEEDDIDSLFDEEKHFTYQKACSFIKQPTNNRSLSPMNAQSHTSISPTKKQNSKIFSPHKNKEGAILQILREKDKLNNQQEQDLMNIDLMPAPKATILKPKMSQSKNYQIKSNQNNRIKPISGQCISTTNEIRYDQSNNNKSNTINQRSKKCRTEYNNAQKNWNNQKDNQRRSIKAQTKGQSSELEQPNFTPNLSKNSLLQMSSCTYDVIARNKLWLQQKQQKLNKIRKDQEEQKLKKEQENSHAPIMTHYKADRVIKSNNCRLDTSINYEKLQAIKKRNPILPIAKIKQKQQSIQDLSLMITKSKQKIICNAKKSPIVNSKQKKQTYEEAVKELHQKIMKMKI